MQLDYAPHDRVGPYRGAIISGMRLPKRYDHANEQQRKQKAQKLRKQDSEEN